VSHHSVVVQLFRADTNATFMEIHSVVTKLITITVGTGMMTSFAAVVDLILFLVFPTNNLHFIL